MGRKTGISSQTISRFELGKQEPRGLEVLISLRNTALSLGLNAEEHLFRLAIGMPIEALPGVQIQKRDLPSAIRIPSYTPQQWRLMQAARLAVLYFPDAAVRMEQAASPVLKLVDRIIQEVDPEMTHQEFAPNFYLDLEHRLSDRAGREAFRQLIRKEDNQ
jgi:hypothetical protein